MAENLDIIKDAALYAKEIHLGQTYVDKEYFYHLQKTFEVAEKFDLAEDVKVACYLHDALEDTEVGFEEIHYWFGWYVAHLVELVTDEEGSNRKERKLKTYSKIKLLHESIMLKLCDRIANVEFCLDYNDINKLNMYRKEQPLFESELKDESSHKIVEMFEYLNKLLQ